MNAFRPPSRSAPSHRPGRHLPTRAAPARDGVTAGYLTTRLVLAGLLVFAGAIASACSGETTNESRPDRLERSASEGDVAGAGDAPVGSRGSSAPADGAAPILPEAAEPYAGSSRRGSAPYVGGDASDALHDSPWPSRGRSLPPPPPPPGGSEPPPWPERQRIPAPEVPTFKDYGVNPWTDPAGDPWSTFALDVDTASYTVARAYLDGGELPPVAAIRTEEVVNALDYGYAPPREGAFALHVAGAPSPFDDADTLVRVGLKAREVAKSERRDAVLTFAIDVSGSMEEGGRLELVKDALRTLIGQLRAGDEVAIVAYSDNAWVVLEPTPAREASRIRAAIAELAPTSSTNAEAGLLLAYQVADRAWRDGAINRVILCSDGVANVGETGPEGILAHIERAVADGITLTAIGVGMGTYNDVLLEQLADRGDGTYHYVDDQREADRVFGEDLVGTLQVVGLDAKAQVSFNPEVVAHYRLIGYENRDVADEDFRDDSVDGGEVGAGHAATALYAVRMMPRADREAVMATARLRWRDPAEGDVRELAVDLAVGDVARSFAGAEPSLRLATAAAALGDLLRDGYWARETDFAEVAAMARSVAGPLGFGGPGIELAELADAAERAGRQTMR